MPKTLEYAHGLSRGETVLYTTQMLLLSFSSLVISVPSGEINLVEFAS